MYLILCWSYLNHSLRFVGGKKRIKKKLHIKSQSQYFGKKIAIRLFSQIVQPYLEQVNHSSNTNVTTKTLEDIKKHSAQDPVAQALCTHISKGWPNHRQAVSPHLHPFWTYREELTVDGGLIFKGQRVFIPEALRP